MTATCAHCEAVYVASRASQSYCSPRCRKAAQRARQAAAGAVVVPVEFGAIVNATRAELDHANALDTPHGQVALVLARLLDGAGPAHGSSVASWAKAHRECLAAAARIEPRRDADPIDALSRIRARRDAKRAPSDRIGH
ncbi:MAG: hypothetical protein WCF36_22260 [Candidatus Nanopelagicales bacterium]